MEDLPGYCRLSRRIGYISGMFSASRRMSMLQCIAAGALWLAGAGVAPAQDSSVVCVEPVEVIALPGKVPPSGLRPFWSDSTTPPPSFFASPAIESGVHVTRHWWFDGERLTELPVHASSEDTAREPFLEMPHSGRFAVAPDGTALFIDYRVQREPAIIYRQDRTTRRFTEAPYSGDRIDWARQIIWSDGYGGFVVAARSGLYLVDHREQPMAVTRLAEEHKHIWHLVDLPDLGLVAFTEVPRLEPTLYVVGMDQPVTEIEIDAPDDKSNLYLSGGRGTLYYGMRSRDRWSGDVESELWAVTLKLGSEGLEVQDPVRLAEGMDGMALYPRRLHPERPSRIDLPSLASGVLVIEPFGELLVEQEGVFTVIRLGGACAD